MLKNRGPKRLSLNSKAGIIFLIYALCILISMTCIICEVIPLRMLLRNISSRRHTAKTSPVPSLNTSENPNVQKVPWKAYINYVISVNRINEAPKENSGEGKQSAGSTFASKQPTSINESVITQISSE